MNIPLPFGTSDVSYVEALRQALAKIESFNPGFLVVAAGMDIYKDDPLGKFKITRDGINQIGSDIAKLQLPTLVVMEGGYDLESIGENFIALLGILHTSLISRLYCVCKAELSSLPALTEYNQG